MDSSNTLRQQYRRWTRLLGAPGLPTDDSPIAAMNIADATEHVLEAAGRPLTSAEIVVALKEAGYKPEADPRSLLTLRAAFKRSRKRFVRGEGGRWAARDL